MYKRCGEIHISDPRTKCDLFDSLVAPILQYACEVWAVDHKHDTCKLEVLHRGFLRKLLGVHDQTPNKSVLGEFGRLPLQFTWWKQIMKFWNRLAKMPRDRLLHGAYLETIELHTKHGCGWYTSVLSWLRENSIQIGENMEVEEIMKAATGVYLKKFLEEDGTKHALYTSVKDMQAYKVEPYLALENFFDRQIMAQIRTGSNFLEVEIGRRTRTAHNDRVCTCCQKKEVEDEQHFIFECGAYEAIRGKYSDLFDDQKDLRKFFMKDDSKRVARFLTQCRTHRSLLRHEIF